jgi:DNA-binding transcriptional MerR regulator
MRIGELAQQAGINIQTVRFYERRKLLRTPSRTPSGYRSYVEADLERVIFIKQSQQLGFTLHEIKQLIEIHEPGRSFDGGHHTGAGEWEKALRIAEERLQRIDEKIRFLQNFRAQLDSVLKDGYSRFCAPPTRQSPKSRPSKMTACPAAAHMRKQRKKPV